MIRALSALVLFTALPALALTDRSGPWEVQVLVGGAPVRSFQHNGQTFLLGQLGERYTLRVFNRGARRIEAVVSVDGRDVVDGKPGDFRTRRGYLVPAFGSVDIDGWRLSQSEAAAFRFSTVADSYAARTGTAREVGVIGVAIFPERRVVSPPPPLVPSPYQGSREGAGAPPEANAAPRTSEDRGAPQASAPSAQKRAAERPGLGTEFGEAVSSQVTEVPFERASRRPDAVIGARYDDRAGLLALGIDVDGVRVPDASELRLSANPFPVVERAYATPPAGWTR